MKEYECTYPRLIRKLTNISKWYSLSVAIICKKDCDLFLPAASGNWLNPCFIILQKITTLSISQYCIINHCKHTMAAQNCFVNVSHLYTQQINIIHTYFSTTAIAYQTISKQYTAIKTAKKRLHYEPRNSDQFTIIFFHCHILMEICNRHH